MYFDVAVGIQLFLAALLGASATYVAVFLCAAAGGSRAPKISFWVLVAGVLFNYLGSEVFIRIIEIALPAKLSPFMRFLCCFTVLLGAAVRLAFFHSTKTDYISALAGILFKQSNGKVGPFTAIAIAVSSIRDACPWVNTQRVLLVTSRNTCELEKVRTQLMQLNLYYSMD